MLVMMVQIMLFLMVVVLGAICGSTLLMGPRMPDEEDIFRNLTRGISYLIVAIAIPLLLFAHRRIADREFFSLVVALIMTLGLAAILSWWLLIQYEHHRRKD